MADNAENALLVEPVFQKLRKNFRSHRTKSYEWRKAQLQAFLRGLDEMRGEFENAVLMDLGRSANATTGELACVKVAAQHDLKHMWTYMRDVVEETELVFAPAKSVVRHEPMGICGIYSAWNYPIMTALKPLV